MPRAIQPVSDGFKMWIQVCLSLKPQWFSQAPGRVEGVGITVNTPDRYVLLSIPVQGGARSLSHLFFKGNHPKHSCSKVSTPSSHPNKVKPSLFRAGFSPNVLVPPPTPAWVPPECSEAPLAYLVPALTLPWNHLFAASVPPPTSPGLCRTLHPTVIVFCLLDI